MLASAPSLVRTCSGLRLCLCLLTGLVPAGSHLRAGALEDYVRRPDDSFSWRQVATSKEDGFIVTHLELTSQTWHEHPWTHHLQVVRPAQVRHPDIGFLFITGDGTGRSSLWIAQAVAERGGAVAAVLTRVPNQPLYDGRREDALIAHTFEQYLKTGDDTWPLLYPMVKSAVRAMDVMQAWAGREHGQKLERFVLSGASKRGWTTWLTSAVDARVAGLAPMVIDMLNMKAQTDWAKKVYGRQSEMIRDYTERGLIEQMDTPAMLRLRGEVDPYSHRNRYRMPKLILLGTNDRYWTVDALRHYWNDLPEPKLLFQTPNAGHNLAGGKDAVQTLAAFFQMIADGQDLPKLQWQMTASDNPGVTVKFQGPAKAARLWTASAPTRDFREARWSSRDLPLPAGATEVSARVEPPATGYRAFMAELTFTARTGHEYRLSTQAQVIPDDLNPKN